jgi:acetyl-CoA carboxylase/biotin carboxylase 1
VKLMHRLDATLKGLDSDAAGNAGAIAAREEALLPFYTQVAHEFADLHDRAGRMKAKGVIREVIHWEGSRGYFYWRLRRRLAEDAVRAQFKVANPAMSRDAVTQALQRAQTAKVGVTANWEDDIATTGWLEADAGNIAKLVATEARTARVASVAKQLAELDPAARRQAMADAGGSA